MATKQTNVKVGVRNKGNKYAYFKTIQIDNGHGWKNRISFAANSKGELLTEKAKNVFKVELAYAKAEKGTKVRVVLRKRKKL